MSSANFLEKLLDGIEVEWMPLGKVAKYSDSRIDSTQVNQNNYVGVDNLLQNRAGKLSSSYVPTEGRLIEYRKGDILIGNIRPYLKKIWLANNFGGASGDVLVIRSTHKALSSEYLHQVLTDDKFFAYNMQHAKGAKMPRGDKAKILEYSIPVPCPDTPKKSLEIQAEIVRILDAMTAHTAELTAELTARKKQYNYYRDKLLSFEDGEVEWKTLEDVAILRRGRVISKGYLSENIGQFPVFSSQTANNGVIGKIDSFDFDGEYISWTTDGANAGTVFHRIGKFSITNVCGLVKIKNESLLNYKFLYYWLSIEAKKHVYSGMGNPKLMSHQVEKIPVPIPYPQDPMKSLIEQKRIASILDKLETLTFSLIEGLPREIELRQKQYAYYRDLLLSFPQAQTA